MVICYEEGLPEGRRDEEGENRRCSLSRGGGREGCGREGGAGGSKGFMGEEGRGIVATGRGTMAGRLLSSACNADNAKNNSASGVPL